MEYLILPIFIDIFHKIKSIFYNNLSPLLHSKGCLGNIFVRHQQTGNLLARIGMFKRPGDRERASTRRGRMRLGSSFPEAGTLQASDRSRGESLLRNDPKIVIRSHDQGYRLFRFVSALPSAWQAHRHLRGARYRRVKRAKFGFDLWYLSIIS
jgi:hypothetical protein